MEKLYIRLLNFTILSVMMPFVYGCQGGGGSSFLGGGASSYVSSGSGGDIIPPPGGDIIPTVHNPEPATMLLLGSGLAAMAYFANKKNDKKHK